MRQRIFNMLAKLAEKKPWLMIIAALVLTMITGGLSENIRMETRILDLLPKDDPASVQYYDIIREYSSATQIMIGIEGDDRRKMMDFADAIEKSATKSTFTDENGKKVPFIKRITVKYDTDFISEHGLMMTKARDLENLDEIFQDLDVVPLLSAYNDFFEREYIEDSGSVTEREKEDRAIDSLKNIFKWLKGVEVAGESPEKLRSYADEVTRRISTGDAYMFSEDDGMLLVMAVPSIAMDEYEKMMEGVRSLRSIIRDIHADYPSLSFRMSGMPLLMVEETEVGFEDMGVSSVISLVLVLGLFILAFRMWTAPILAVITLMMGIMWTSGFIALTFGRLNLFTLMFAVILVGLGIDFSIHMNAAFSTARGAGRSIGESLREMYKRAGPGVMTGALTTAAAFFALALSGLEAFIELGIVLGAGILLTMIASMTVLPAMYSVHARVSDRMAGKSGRRPRGVRLALPFLGTLGGWISKKPWPVMIMFIVVTLVIGWAVKRAQWQYDMLEIEPPDMPSVTLHRDILDRFELNPDFSMFTVPDMDDARPAVKKLKKNRLIGQVDSITDFIPTEKEFKRRQRIIKRIRQRMRKILEPGVLVGLPSGAAVLTDPDATAGEAQPDAGRFLEELRRFNMNVVELGQLSFTAMKMRLYRVCSRLSGSGEGASSEILALAERLKKKDLKKLISDYESGYVPLLAQRIYAMSSTERITLDMLPDSIRDRYVGTDGSFLVTIYSAVDTWHSDKMDLFINAVSKASDRVTGTVILMDRMIELVGSKGLMATFLALGTIFIILLVDYRNFGHAVLGMIPLMAGFVWMVGLFVLFGRKFDVANVMALPLVLGIGIDDAVHMIHSVRRQGIRELTDVMTNTGRALVLTSLTTAIAFGSISFASHRGMAGMGQLLVLGVGGCLVASLVLLPALMKIFFRDKESQLQKKGG